MSCTEDPDAQNSSSLLPIVLPAVLRGLNVGVCVCARGRACVRVRVRDGGRAGRVRRSVKVCVCVCVFATPVVDLITHNAQHLQTRLTGRCASQHNTPVRFCALFCSATPSPPTNTPAAHPTHAEPPTHSI